MKNSKNTKFNIKNWYSKQDTTIKFLICIILVFLLLLIFKLTYISTGVTKSVTKDSNIKTDKINLNTNNYSINIKYPTFKNIEIKKIVRTYIYDYSNDFINKCNKNNKTNNKLEIDYEITFLNDYLLIYFKINDSTNPLRVNKSILIDNNNSKKALNEYLFTNSDKFKKIVTKKVCNKYRSDICKEIKNININDYDINIKKERMDITFNNFNTDIIISYIPEVSINIEELKNIYNYNTEYVFNEIKYEEKEEKKKYVAFTFDDGPSKYTNDIIDTLLLNDSSATFFELGSKMKNNREIMLRIKSNNMEIGGHSYSHKQLTTLTKKNINFELNTTNIIYNKIIDENLKLVRPPYGSVNSYVTKKSPFIFVNWNVDTLDWKSRNSKKIYKHIIKDSKDGDIILMHDIYDTTAEAVRMAVPELKANGYEIVTVSKLAEIKNKELINGRVYYSFN